VHYLPLPPPQKKKKKKEKKKRKEKKNDQCNYTMPKKAIWQPFLVDLVYGEKHIE
jgi:hypothetical protein